MYRVTVKVERLEGRVVTRTSPSRSEEPRLAPVILVQAHEQSVGVGIDRAMGLLEAARPVPGFSETPVRLRAASAPPVDDRGEDEEEEPEDGL